MRRVEIQRQGIAIARCEVAAYAHREHLARGTAHVTEGVAAQALTDVGGDLHATVAGAYHVEVFRAHAERSEEHTSELQSRENLVCRLLLGKKKAPLRRRATEPSPRTRSAMPST